MNLKDKIKLWNVKCRFCKKQNLAYEVPCFYDHKALDETQLHFKKFCQDMGATSVSINEWMNKKDVINTHTHTHPGILHSHKKEWNLAIYNNMDGLGGYYAKWNKSDRERQILNLKKYNRLVNIATQQKKKQTSRYREQISGYQWGEGREKGQQG